MDEKLRKKEIKAIIVLVIFFILGIMVGMGIMATNIFFRG